MRCQDCGLPDPYNGRGDGIGSCGCPRCDECGDAPGYCDCGSDAWYAQQQWEDEEGGEP